MCASGATIWLTKSSIAPDRNRFQYGAARQSESNAVNPSDLEFTASTGAAGTTGSSAYASPSPTASAAVASSWVAPTASSSSSSSASSKTFTGEATYFYQNGVAGACGTVHSDDEKVVALMTTMVSLASAENSLNSDLSLTAVRRHWLAKSVLWQNRCHHQQRQLQVRDGKHV